jgi:DNA recombination protein RmuC
VNLVLLAILGLAVVLVLLWLAAQTAATKASAEALARRLESFEKTVDSRMEQSQTAIGLSLRTMADHGAESSKILKNVGEELGRVSESSRKIQELAGEVTRLEDLLKPPKIRGLLGEVFLEEALRQVLPPGSYEMQKRFRDGEIVDAAIRLGDRLVPVDSKFPYENYRRAQDLADEAERRRAIRTLLVGVKKQVDDIAAKYIRVGEGTYEFALMYIPAEAVYAEVVVEGEEGSVADYAVSRRVIPVSPRLLYAYLSTIALGLRGLEIEKSAHEIIARLANLSRGLDKVESPFEKLGGHLSNALKQYEETDRQLRRFAEEVRNVSDEGERAAEKASLDEGPTSLKLFPSS